MKKFLPLTVVLAGIALAVSGCSTATPGPGTAVPTTSAPASPASPSAAAATGWEMTPKGGADRIKAAGLEVLNAEGAAEHFHAHLEIFVDGKPVTVPADIGFSFTAAGQPNGISALHTHDESGIIHIEAPVAGETYTLGQLLTEWGVLDGADKTPGSAHSPIAEWSAVVNGKRQDSPAQAVVLKAHDEIVLYHGTAPSPLPTTYKFPEGV
ncbi:hypothetical protein [Arthrobacter sp. 92]|uniref:hypothetical protein n=1 Tax=Arthrobacter sp. 92 TaxID=3418175 RepID=UPI003CFF9CF6